MVERYWIGGVRGKRNGGGGDVLHVDEEGVEFVHQGSYGCDFWVRVGRVNKIVVDRDIFWLDKRV